VLKRGLSAVYQCDHRPLHQRHNCYATRPVVKLPAGGVLKRPRPESRSLYMVPIAFGSMGVHANDRRAMGDLGTSYLVRSAFFMCCGSLPNQSEQTEQGCNSKWRSKLSRVLVLE
jgi:hypothetical protein